MSTPDDAPSPHLRLLDAFIDAWGDLTVFPAQHKSDSRPAPGFEPQPIAQRAFLVLDSWEDNPYAEQLQDALPRWAMDRFTVPDPYFKGREDKAPCLLELSATLILPRPEQADETRALRAWLEQCMKYATRQTHARLLPQHFCGFVISDVNEQHITRHWAQLADQQVPTSGKQVLFRFQDPRVMQRMWPELSNEQRTRWLGPVSQWWSLQQPWGPMADTLDPDARAEPSRWFVAKRPTSRPANAADSPDAAPSATSPRDLFDAHQWFLGALSPDANSVWRSYARNGVAPEHQPDAQSMQRMLADAAELGLTRLNLEDYVWATWLHNPRDGKPRVMDWRLPHTSPTLDVIMARMRADPETRFSTQFVKATQAPNTPKTHR